MTNTQPTIPLLSTSTGPGASTHIDLAFNTAMARGTGTIFVTDGAVQTVIDRVTGQPTMRIVGASFTREISASSVTIDGTDVKFDVSGLPAGQHYSVVMDPGVLVTTANKPFAGVRTPGQLAFQSAPDTQPPGVTSVELDGSTLSAGHSIGVTITFSEAVRALDPAAIDTPHATLGNLQSADGGRVWHATLTGVAGIVSDANKVRIDMSMVRDLAGNAGSGMASSPSYAVDTLVMAVLEQHLGINDLGAIRDDYITADDERYLSGHFTGTLGASQHLKLTIDGVAVASDAIHTEVNAETSVNGWYYEDSGKFADGVHNIKAWIEDDSGKIGIVLSQAITIDTHDPTITLPTDGSTPFDVAAPLTITFSEPVFWDSHGADHEVIHLANVSDGTVRDIYVDDRNLSSDHRTLTISADDLHLLDAKDYRVTLPTSIIDLAGNELGENEITFHTQGAYVDLTGPRALRADATIDGSSAGTSFGAGTVITIRVRFSEPVKFAGAPLPTLGLNNGAHAGSATISEDKLEVSFRYTVADGDGDTQHLAIFDTSALVGRIADLAGNLLTAADIDTLGFDDDEAIPIDTHAPAPLAAARVAASSDTGTSDSDGITKISTPTLGGSGAEAGALDIRIYEGASLIGHGSSNDDGTWSATVNAASGLTDGVHTLVVKQVDQAGHESAGSPAVTVTVDTTPPPALPAPLGDSGVINHSTPTFTGSGAAAGSIIKLYASTNGHEFEAGHTLSGADGAWSIPTDKLDDGSYSISVKQFDAAGNVSPASPAVAVTIDTVPPAAPGEPVLDVNSDKGVSSNDGITNINTPTFSGTGAEANSVVKLYANEQEVGNTLSDAQGNWHITTGVLRDDTYSVVVKQFDKAGNMSGDSGSIDVTIDTVAPKLLSSDFHRSSGSVELTFSEDILLAPHGTFALENEFGLVVDFLGAGATWKISHSGTVLELDDLGLLRLAGTLHLVNTGGSLQDAAGNVVLVGSAGTFSIPL
jgi:hypothetical protein